MNEKMRKNTIFNVVYSQKNIKRMLIFDYITGRRNRLINATLQRRHISALKTGQYKKNNTIQNLQKILEYHGHCPSGLVKTPRERNR